MHHPAKPATHAAPTRPPPPGRDEAGAAAERALLAQPGAEHLAGSVLLRLEDELSSGDPAFADARSFRAFCPVDALPAVRGRAGGGPQAGPRARPRVCICWQAAAAVCNGRAQADEAFF